MLKPNHIDEQESQTRWWEIRKQTPEQRKNNARAAMIALVFLSILVSFALVMTKILPVYGLLAALSSAIICVAAMRLIYALTLAPSWFKSQSPNTKRALGAGFAISTITLIAVELALDAPIFVGFFAGTVGPFLATAAEYLGFVPGGLGAAIPLGIMIGLAVGLVTSFVFWVTRAASAEVVNAELNLGEQDRLLEGGERKGDQKDASCLVLSPSVLPLASGAAQEGLLDESKQDGSNDHQNRGSSASSEPDVSRLYAVKPAEAVPVEVDGELLRGVREERQQGHFPSALSLPASSSALHVAPPSPVRSAPEQAAVEVEAGSAKASNQLLEQSLEQQKNEGKRRSSRGSQDSISRQLIFSDDERASTLELGLGLSPVRKNSAEPNEQRTSSDKRLPGSSGSLIESIIPAGSVAACADGSEDKFEEVALQMVSNSDNGEPDPSEDDLYRGLDGSSVSASKHRTAIPVEEVEESAPVLDDLGSKSLRKSFLERRTSTGRNGSPGTAAHTPSIFETPKRRTSQSPIHSVSNGAGSTVHSILPPGFSPVRSVSAL
jgi:hypothetical protein